MLPFKRILCPTDFSAPSIFAVQAAADLAHAFTGEVYLVNVVAPVALAAASVASGPTSPREQSGSVSLYNDDSRERSERSLRALAEKHVQGGIPTHLLVENGEPAERITALAATHGMDLIVISTHGETGWRRFVFGSVTERVVRTATVPVLVLQPQRSV